MKMNRSIVSDLSQAKNVSPTQAVSFKPGQILNGKILKLFPNSIATLQVGSQKVVAQLEASLEVNENYWLQVQPGEGKVRLKLIGKVEEKSQSEGSLATLIKELSLPLNKENEKALRFFLKENLPISKETLQETVRLLKGSSTNKAGLEAIKTLVMKEYPITKMSFQAITEVMNKGSMTNHLQALQDQLLAAPSTKEGIQLLNFLDRLNSPQLKEAFTILDSDTQASNEQGPSLEQKNSLLGLNKTMDPMSSPITEPSSFAGHLKGLMKSMGFSYEHEVVQFLKHPEGKELT